MPEKRPPAPIDALKSLDMGSRKIKLLATELSNRIIAFENWLNSFPGRVATTLWIVDPEMKPEECSDVPLFGLRLERSSKRWILVFAHRWGEDDEPPSQDWIALTEASLQVKLKAVELFPNFLEQLAEEQKKLAQRLESANGAFDEFALQLGIGRTGEGGAK